MKFYNLTKLEDGDTVYDRCGHISKVIITPDCVIKMNKGYSTSTYTIFGTYISSLPRHTPAHVKMIITKTIIRWFKTNINQEDYNK